MNYIIRDNRITQLRQMLQFKGQADTHSLDYSPWADDGGTVSACVISVESGQGAVSSEALTSNVKTFVLTTSELGSTMLKFTATAGNNTHIVYLRILVKDPRQAQDDYGFFYSG